MIPTGIDPVRAADRTSPGLGRPADPADIAPRDWTITADGSGLPRGSGSVGEGRRLYEQHCLSCHGRDGLGDSGDQLAGARMQLTDEWPEKTVGSYWPYAPTLFDFIRRSMPMTAPGTLTDDEIYAVTAYILWLNNIITADTVLDAAGLAGIRMPNRDGFIPVLE